MHARQKSCQSHFDLYCLSERQHSDLHSRIPPTLDEYCSYALGRDLLTKRNQDQVVTRWQQHDLKLPEQDAKLVTVSQVWVWMLGDTIVTSFPDNVDPSGDNHLEFAHGRLALYEGLGKLRDEPGPQNEAVALLLSNLVNRLDRHETMGLKEPIFTTFEKSIWDVQEKVRDYLQSHIARNLDIDHEESFLHEIEDIRDELSMIKTVVSQQEDVWKDFVSILRTRFSPTGGDDRIVEPNIDPDIDKFRWNIIMRPAGQFTKFKRRIARLDEQAQRIETSILTRLSLNQTHANLKQSHASLDLARSSAIMSATVFGFTVITIVFTPLSFMTSLLALPLVGIDQSQLASPANAGSVAYTTDFLGKWMGKQVLFHIE